MMITDETPRDGELRAVYEQFAAIMIDAGRVEPDTRDRFAYVFETARFLG